MLSPEAATFIDRLAGAELPLVKATPGGTVMDTPEGVSLYQFLVVLYRVRLEVDSGIHFRVSSLPVARKLYGVKSRTRKGALRELLEIKAALDERLGLEARA